MGQSNYIAAAIIVAFLVFITAKGSLPKYITLMTGGAGFSPDTPAPPKQTGDTKSNDSSKTPDATSGVPSSSPVTRGDVNALKDLTGIDANGVFDKTEEILDAVKFFGGL